MLIILFGCMPIPYPHKVVTHSTITGRVVDADSREPVAYINVGVRSDSESNVTTGGDGLFRLPSRERWRPFVVVPLLPFEPLWLDEIVLHDTFTGYHQRAVHYRAEKIEVKSHPIAPIDGGYRGRENLGIVDELGDIPIMRMPALVESPSHQPDAR